MHALTSVDDLAALVRAQASPAVVVVGIAGYGGSGKSTLARALLRRLPEATLTAPTEAAFAERYRPRENADVRFVGDAR